VPTLRRCGNCRSYITVDELQTRRPPPHPWPLTPDGARALAENEARGGDNPQCPECGQRAFLPR